MQSKRERIIMIIAAAVIGLLVLDQFVITPVLAWRADLIERDAQSAAALAEGTSLLEHRGQLERRWRDMIAGGMHADAGDALQAMTHALNDWATDSGLRNLAVNRDRASGDRNDPLERVTMRVTATGPMRAVKRFLERAEAASFPIRVSQLQLAARREGEDDLAIQLQISTIVVRGDDAAREQPRRAPADDDASAELETAATSTNQETRS